MTTRMETTTQTTVKSLKTNNLLLKQAKQPQNTTVWNRDLLHVRLLLGGASQLLLLLQLLQTLLVRGGLLAGVLQSSLLFSHASALVAQSAVRHQTLDLRSLVSLVTVVLELAANHELSHVVLLRQTEQLADVARSLRTQAAGSRGRLVRQSGDLLLALLHDHQVQHADIRTHDAPTHRLSLALALPFTATHQHYVTTRSVARHAVRQQQAHTVVAQHTLLHRETLLVVSSSDASHSQPHDQTLPEDVALELVAQAIALHFLGDSLVHESTATPSRPIRRVLQLVLIIDVERLLRTQSGIADVQLGRHETRVEATRGIVVARTYLHIPLE